MRREGYLALEDMLQGEKYFPRDIFELGLLMIIDGTNVAFVDKVLNNLIDLETEKDEKMLKIIQKEAVLGISAGESPRMLYLLLNSYVNKDVKEAMKIFHGM